MNAQFSLFCTGNGAVGVKKARRTVKLDFVPTIGFTFLEKDLLLSVAGVSYDLDKELLFVSFPNVPLQIINHVINEYGWEEVEV